MHKTTYISWRNVEGILKHVHRLLSLLFLPSSTSNISPCSSLTHGGTEYTLLSCLHKTCRTNGFRTSLLHKPVSHLQQDSNSHNPHHPIHHHYQNPHHHE